MRRFASRLMNKQVAAAWGQWIDCCDQMGMLAHAGNKMMMRELLKGCVPNGFFRSHQQVFHQGVVCSPSRCRFSDRQVEQVVWSG